MAYSRAKLKSKGDSASPCLTSGRVNNRERKNEGKKEFLYEISVMHE